MRPQWRAPLGFSKIDRHRQTLKLCRKKAPVAGHHRSACSGVKALRNTSDARRQAAKLCYRFGPLTPSARSANLIAGDGTKNGFPAPNKEPAKTKNHHLTGKAPYKFESIPLQRGVACEPHRHSGAAWLDHHYPLALDNVTTRQSGCRATEQDAVPPASGRVQRPLKGPGWRFSANARAASWKSSVR